MTEEGMFVVGQRVFFWTGRGSEGFGTILDFHAGRALIAPEPEAKKGSDFRPRTANANEGGRTRDYWGPRDHGVPLRQLNTPARPWYQGN